MRNFFYTIPILFFLATVAQTGCSKDDGILWNTLAHVFRNAYENRETIRWHQKHAWKAEEFFDDPKVIALCNAIDAKDLKEIDRLVASGADANAKGKGNMTPLLWSFSEDNQEVFKRILEHGANPNVVVTSDFNTKGIHLGDSVLHFAAGMAYPNFFKYVMQHGGDPNLIDKDGDSPLKSVLRSTRSNKQEDVQLLIDAGANLDYGIDTGDTASYMSLLSGRYSITLQLLEAGASFHYFDEKKGYSFVHRIVPNPFRKKPPGDIAIAIPEEEPYRERILEWLEANGVDLAEIRKDFEIWAKGGKLSPERIAELKKRSEDELASKRAAKENKAMKE